jgi:predicted nucleic acid-binding protein
VIDIQPSDAPADTAFAQLRAQLEAAGAPIGGNDMLIAAPCARHRLGTHCEVASFSAAREAAAPEQCRKIGFTKGRWLEFNAA